MYESLRILSLRYKQLIKCRTRILNFLRSSLELTFPELNQIFKNAYAVLALQMFRMYGHPDFLVGLTLKEMTNRVYQSVSRLTHKDVIQSYFQHSRGWSIK